MRYPTGTKKRQVSKRLPLRTSNKYRAQKTVLNGLKFDSKVEARYYCQIQYQSGWTRQEHFDLIPKFKCGDKNYRKAVYTPDFIHRTNNEIDKVVDVKGGNVTLKDSAKLRMKLFMAKYGVPVTIAQYDYKNKSFNETQV